MIFINGEKSNPYLSVYECGKETCWKYHTAGPAVRDHYLIHYLADGEGEYTVEGRTYNLKKGDGFLICPSVKTYYKANPDNPYSYYWVGFHGISAKKLLSMAGLDENNLMFHYDKDGRIEDCLSELVKASKEQITYEISMLGRLYVFLSILIQNNMTASDVTETGSEYLNKVIDYIQENYSNDVSVTEIAGYIGLSRSHLFRLFKSQLNLSPQEYIICYRLDKTRQLLRYSNLPISNVAYSCGFKDLAHFSRAFKRHFGCSPSQYRKLHFEVTG